ncbi:MAG: hypothetical protein J5980_12410 [Muribaculaceae bacterium]|nr:hypothetical protein [Muribaculaceae bacterium]
MKKYLTMMVAVMLAAMSLGLAACGDDKDEPKGTNAKDLIGTWESDIVRDGVDGMEFFYESGESLIQFRNDGTMVSVNVLVLKDEYVFDGKKEDIEVEYGTWSVEGDKIYREGEDGAEEVMTFKVKSNALTLTTTSGIIASLTFTKVPDSRINKYL